MQFSSLLVLLFSISTINAFETGLYERADSLNVYIPFGSTLDNCYLQRGDANGTRNSRLVVPKASLASRAGFVLERSLMERIKMALHAS